MYNQDTLRSLASQHLFSKKDNNSQSGLKLNISQKNNSYKLKYGKQMRKYVHTKKLTLAKDIYDNPLVIVQEFTFVQLKVLRFFFQRSVQVDGLYMNQDTIAKILRLSRKTVNKVIGYFSQLGIIQKVYRGNRISCKYKISSFFGYRRAQELLLPFLPEIKNVLYAAKKCICFNLCFAKKVHESIMRPIAGFRKWVTRYISYPYRHKNISKKDSYIVAEMETINSKNTEMLDDYIKREKTNHLGKDFEQSQELRLFEAAANDAWLSLLIEPTGSEAL